MPEPTCALHKPTAAAGGSSSTALSVSGAAASQGGGCLQPQVKPAAPALTQTLAPPGFTRRHGAQRPAGRRAHGHRREGTGATRSHAHPSPAVPSHGAAHQPKPSQEHLDPFCTAPPVPNDAIWRRNLETLANHRAAARGFHKYNPTSPSPKPTQTWNLRAAREGPSTGLTRAPFPQHRGIAAPLPPSLLPPTRQGCRSCPPGCRSCHQGCLHADKARWDPAAAGSCRHSSPARRQPGGTSAAAPGSSAQESPARGRAKLSPADNASSQPSSNKGPDPHRAQRINRHNFPPLSPIRWPDPSPSCTGWGRRSTATEPSCLAPH